MQIEFAQILREERHHAGVVRAGRQFGEDDVFALHEIFHPENAVAAQIVDYLARHILRGGKGGVGHGGGLPAFLIIAPFLPVADRRAEMDTVAGADGEQGDFIVEGDKFLDDHAAAVAAHVGDGVGPGGLQFGGAADRALPLAGRGHDRFDDAGKAGVVGAGDHLVQAFGIAIA